MVPARAAIWHCGGPRTTAVASMALDPANPGAAPRPEGGQAQVRNLFPTPVAILAVPDAARIDDALAARRKRQLSRQAQKR